MRRSTAMVLAYVIVALTMMAIITVALHAWDPMIGLPWDILMTLLIGIFLYKSIHRIKGESMLLIFFMSTLVRAVASGTAKQSFKHESMPSYIHDRIQTTSFLGLADLVFIPWPFFSGVATPLHTLQVHIDRVAVLTRGQKETEGHEESAQTQLLVDSTLYLRLSPLYIVHLLVSLGITDSIEKSGYKDLSNKEQITYNGVNEDGEKVEMTYTESCIAKFIQSILQNAVHDGIREAAGDLLWESVANNEPIFRHKVMRYIAEDHLFQQAGLLKIDDDDRVKNGNCVTNLEFKVERIGIDPALQAAIQKVRIAALNAQSDKREGEGKRDLIEELKETGCTAQEALGFLALQNMPESTRLSIIRGDVLTAGMESLVGQQKTEN